jgi:hypothetical protein
LPRDPARQNDFHRPRLGPPSFFISLPNKGSVQHGFSAANLVSAFASRLGVAGKRYFLSAMKRRLNFLLLPQLVSFNF